MAQCLCRFRNASFYRRTLLALKKHLNPFQKRSRPALLSARLYLHHYHRCRIVIRSHKLLIFYFPTEDIDTVLVFGPRRGKVIISARTRDESLHIGRALSEQWGKWTFRRSQSISRWPIPFENLLGDIPDEPLEAAAAAVNAMHQKLIEMFSSGDE